MGLSPTAEAAFRRLAVATLDRGALTGPNDRRTALRMFGRLLDRGERPHPTDVERWFHAAGWGSSAAAALAAMAAEVARIRGGAQ